MNLEENNWRTNANEKERREQIELITKELKEYWLNNPELRLGQLIENVKEEENIKDLFYLEDKSILEILKEK